jgi:hypothetical protein
MFVEELQGSLLLLDSDEFLGAFAVVVLVGVGVVGSMYAWCRHADAGAGVQSVLGLAVRWRRHAGQRGMLDPGRWGRLSRRAGAFVCGCALQSFTAAMMLRCTAKCEWERLSECG